MSVWLDVIGSFVFGTLLGLHAMRLSDDMTGYAHRGLQTYIAQADAVTISEVIAEDLQKAGHNVSGPAIAIADSTHLKFLADLNADGSADAVEYTLSPPDSTGAFEIKRIVNDSPPYLLGWAQLRFSYYNAAGDSLALPVATDAVKQIGITLKVKHAGFINPHPALAFATLRVSPENLK